MGGQERSRSACEPFREIIEAKLDQGLTAQRIYQDLAADHGFGSKYHSVRRFVKKLTAAAPLELLVSLPIIRSLLILQYLRFLPRARVWRSGPGENVNSSLPVTPPPVSVTYRNAL